MEENKHNNSDLSMIFENFIKTGRVEKEKEIVKGFTIRLKVLNTGELLIAESIMNSNSAPADIVARVRAASILSQALITLNGSKIERDDFTKEEIRIRRSLLYTELLKMPAMVIQKTYKFYIDCVEEQNSKYQDIPAMMEEIENF